MVSQAGWVYRNTYWPSDLQFQLHLFFGICVCKSVIIKVWYVDLDFLDVGIRKTDVTPMKGLLPTRGYRVRIIPGQGELGNNNNFRRCKNKTTVWNQDETNEANLKICKEDCQHARWKHNTTENKRLYRQMQNSHRQFQNKPRVYIRRGVAYSKYTIFTKLLPDCFILKKLANKLKFLKSSRMHSSASTFQWPSSICKI